MQGDSNKIIIQPDGYGFEFRFQYGRGKAEVTVKLPDPDANLDDLAEVFECFLRACGYSSTLEVSIGNRGESDGK